MDSSINHSFGVIAFKDSPFLKDCLESLKNQTRKSHIYITTSTPSAYISNMAAEYGVPVYITESGRGIAHDWNFCIKQAKTKYITLAHQDDIYLPDYTERCLQKAIRYDDMQICFTAYSELVDGVERKGGLLLAVKSLIFLCFMPLRKNMKSIFLKKRLISLGSPIAAPGVMYNLENLQWFEFSEAFTVNLDWDAWYHMASKKGRFIFVNRILFRHRIHAGSATTVGIENANRKKEDLIMFRRLWPNWIALIIARFYERSYKMNH